ncbi:hypothetical protein HID58_085310 [Brassica napus]|uniref:Uncharacterized protein n=1 Tax=Brassica napus TaxID=3708 RepID=A0ABQ7XM76_BRANA|nr:hypothetical protein HID58_085310 [Brassica napus]
MIVMFWSRVLLVLLVLLSTTLRFANFIWFSLPTLFSHLVAVWIVFSSVYAQWAWKVVFGIKLELWFFGGWLRFSLPQVASGIKLELWFFGGWLPFSLPQSMWFFAGMGALPVHI